MSSTFFFFNVKDLPSCMGMDRDRGIRPSTSTCNKLAGIMNFRMEALCFVDFSLEEVPIILCDRL